MKKIILFGTIILFALATMALAQDLESTELQQSDERDLDIILSHEVQDPGSKEFFLVADIKSGIDSDRVIVEWNLPRGIKLASETDLFRSRATIYEGRTTIVKKLVVPAGQGKYQVEAVVTAIKADANYISTDSIQIEFNDNKEIIPLSEEYKQAKLQHQIIRVLIYIAIISGISLVSYYIYREIKKIRS